MLNNDAALPFQQRVHVIRDLVHLGKCHLKTDIHVKGAGIPHVQERGTHLHDFVWPHDIVVVRQLQSGNIPLIKEDFRAGIANDADQPVRVRKVFMGDLLAQKHQSLFAAWREILGRYHVLLNKTSHRLTN